jgi:hypothetical protein
MLEIKAWNPEMRRKGSETMRPLDKHGEAGLTASRLVPGFSLLARPALASALTVFLQGYSPDLLLLGLGNHH